MLKRWKQKFAAVLALILTACMLAGCAAAVQETIPAQSETSSAAVQETIPAQVETSSAAVQETIPAQSETTSAAVQSEKIPVQTETTSAAVQSASAAQVIAEDGSYTSKEEVALYLHTYGHLPDNYITKKEAEKLGWNSSKGNLWDAAPGMSIGGSRFGNYEKRLPEKKGRRYYECDIDYEGGYRGAKRLIYSDDGLIFYTDDHYKTFEQLYEAEKYAADDGLREQESAVMP